MDIYFRAGTRLYNMSQVSMIEERIESPGSQSYLVLTLPDGVKVKGPKMGLSSFQAALIEAGARVYTRGGV
jgi:hypothetical protein